MFKSTLTPRDIAERYHRCLPEHIRQYLKDRGIPATIIDRQRLGWNGERITIPIFGREGEVLTFRYAKAPDDVSDDPEVVSDTEAEPQLYGWETLARVPYRVVICDGELERLVLEARGFPAVAVSEDFQEEWASHFEAIKEIYICFRQPRSGDAANAVQRVLPRARIAQLPDDVGENGSIIDFFLGLQKTELDFEVVLAGALASGPASPEGSPVIRTLRPVHKSMQRRADRLRKSVPLHQLVSQFTTLHASGNRLVGHCPLHDDRSSSFTVFLDTDTYRCSGCEAEGDVVTFLMDKESMTFGQALEALERFEFTHELYGTD